MAQGPSIVIGIDFGTTFSGIAWGLEGSIDDIEVISSWPGGGNRTSVKVPSAITYQNANILWGYQVGSLMEAFRGIKLLLDESQETKYQPSIASKGLLVKYNKDVTRVASDYFGRLLGHIREVLQRRFGMRANEMNLQYTLTVPAVWSDKAKDHTLTAAIKAGIKQSEISLISEPEAAALYALRAIQPNSTTKNDVFVVCDAGGGTVDLITYQVKNLEPLNLVEVAKGTGRVCGSMILDLRFEDLLRRRMGERDYGLLSNKSKEAAIVYWQDRVKPNFMGKFDDDFTDVDYFIPVPGAKDNRKVPIEEGFFQISSDDVEDIFEPVVQDIEELIAEQIESVKKNRLEAKAILLVGGFGSSEYLFRRVQKANPTSLVIQPPNAWSAVVSGAVHRGLEGNRVESRIARRHYGIVCTPTYDPSIHGSRKKFWDSLEEKYRVYDDMQWYINKFSSLYENKPIKMNFYRSIKVGDEAGLLFKEKLHFCNDEQAPKMKNKRVLQLCSLSADLSRIPRELFEKKRNSRGVEYYRIFFTLAMNPTSASLLFELEFNGVSYGSVRSKY